MFYSQFILAKKGPLGTIWIAAHLERKLRKNQVADTNIGISVDSILFPEMPIALRLSSHLLLGVVRIYSRKVNYLFDDCSEALLKVKQAFQSTAVDLPPEESTAPYHSITLPETFDLDDFELPDNDILQGSYVDQHVGSKDQITLQDTMEGVIYSTSKFGLDERFGDGDASGLDLNEELLVEKDATAGDAGDMLDSDVHPQPSFQARPSLKHDENQDTLIVDDGVDQIDDDFEGDNEPVEYAHAPCTPVVWEEPDLSNIQETSACDDHPEPENCYVTEYAVNENLRNASCNVPHEQENDQSESQEKPAPPGVQSFNDNRENWAEVQGHLNTQLESNAEILVEDENHDDPVQVTDVASFHSLFISAREEPSNASGNSTLVQGERPHSTNTLELNLQETYFTERRHDEESYNATQRDNTYSYTSDFPAAEKLLSVPERFSDVVSHVLPESTPTQEDIMMGNGGHSVSDMLTGKKRGFTESLLMTQISNVVETSGLLTTKTTAGSVPDDEDLLSSILVGRFSVLKMKPTPPPEMPSKRRRQSAPRSAVAKRKVPMDDNMVMHGDTIRQQLINTEDIRRLRKKAPCTWLEISMIQKQFWEYELFDETLFTGVSVKLASLHNQPYDISRIRVSKGETCSQGETILKSILQNDEPNVPDENRHETDLHPPANKDVWEAEPFEMPVSSGNQPCENNITNSHLYGSQEHMHVTEPISSENVLSRQSSEMKIEGENLSVPDVGNSGASLGEIPEAKHKLVAVGAEDDASIETLMGLEPGHVANASCTLSSETDGVRPDVVTLDQDIEEIKKNEEEFVNDEKTLQPPVECNAKNLVPDATYGEEVAAATEVICGSKDVFLDDIERPGHQDAYKTATTHTEDNAYSNRDDDEVECSAVVNDTDFLNFDDDDDDEAEAAGDDLTDNEAKCLIDNSGWSSRTRGVAKYLQVMFDKEGARGRMSLHMNNLLNGKTRKEASRMFFETLVLKTKDYIHVEQSEPFENIDILPRSKFLKSDF